MKLNKKLIGFVVGLMIAASAVYVVETIEEFEEEDMIKGPFFLAVAIGYIIAALWIIRKDSKISYIVVIAGTIGIIILYAVTRTDMAISLGMEAGRIGHLGIVSKVLQVGVVAGLILALIQSKKLK